MIRVRVPAHTLHPIPLANSGAVRVDDPVVAIGSPFGLSCTVTVGIVSAMGRSLPAPNGFTIVARSRPTSPSTRATRAARYG